jgi:signal transduction histidine kinase
VKLLWRGSHVELTVRDTGLGIPEGELEQVFQRFHRGERRRARTHEGSGIGLALVRELVTMHGGAIRVESVVDEGTTFTVSIPAGYAHLPADHVSRDSTAAISETVATPYVQEALRWLPTPPPALDAPAAEAQTPATSGRILVADDNADMRDYITRLLSHHWTVEVVRDGRQALDAVLRERPDVLVSDVMMPGLDGFALLRAIREHERTRTLPVILLSARAGEEARVEGLNAGADDYLVKPFSARELVARVQTQVLRGRIRSIEEAHALRLATIFEHAPVGCAILRGPDHVFEFANRSYAAMVGGRPLVGRPAREALPELERQSIEGQPIFGLLDHVFASGQPFAGKGVRAALDRGKGREDAFFDFVYQPLFDEGEVSGIAVLCFDVTELVAARGEAERANRAKDEFLAMLGHELRNPLAPILTALQLLRLRNVESGAREREVIERQVRHLVRLVDDLLDISRITRGKIRLRREPVDLSEAVSRAIEMTSPAMEERNHSVSVDVPRGLVVLGDSARLAQILANLLTNAAKYTDPGGDVRVTASQAGGSIAISVTDNGNGIAPEMMPRLFELFSQERQEIDRSQGGLGLGLAVVRGLVEAHGGSIGAHSDGKGHGATFTVQLPAAAATVPPAAEAARPSRAAEGKAVLVVDDNPDAADLLADSLRALGHDVRVAADGPSALELVRSFRPDVALLDLGLPVMDGFELARRLKEDPSLHSVALIAVTGYGQEIDRRRSRAAGFDAHLVKPVDVDALNALIGRSGSREIGAVQRPEVEL